MAVISRLTRAASLLVIALAVTTMSACAPEPQPSPAPTPAFASEEEAFAAAEEVYRAYNEAVNAERRGDPDAEPRDYLVGLALDGDTNARQILGGEGLVISGDGVIADITNEGAEISSGNVSVEMRVCLDVSSTRVLDESGSDVTPEGRQLRVPLRITMTDSAHGLVISESTADEGASC